MQFVENKDMIN